ncbi:MAG: GNAT family N-acetyltransferase [Bacteroidota bacterium]
MEIRKATWKDLADVVKLLADDQLGSKREMYQLPLPEVYQSAFEKILADDNQELMVLCDETGVVIGTMQLSFIQYLTYKGGVRAQIEAVRIAKEKRGEGLGKHMFRWAIDRAKERKAHVMQLTTDKLRPEALKFYEKLGFKASHEGMKLHL